MASPSPLGRPIPTAPIPTQPVPTQPNPNPPNPSPAGAPQVPPPGGQADLLPPTNNPKMAISAADLGGAVASQTQPSLFSPASGVTPAPSQTVTGTAVAPFAIMQQMGLAPDPPSTSSTSALSANSPAGNGSYAAVGPVGTATADNVANRAKVRVADTTKTVSNNAATAATKSSTPEQGPNSDAASTTSANPNPK